MSEIIEPGQKAADLLREILVRMGVVAEVSQGLQEGRIVLNIEGDDIGVAIGAKGRTLDALQLIVARALNRGQQEMVSVVVDGAGYRARRADTLRDLALRLRERVVRTGEPAEIDDLTAAERRIVHSALAEAGGVSSHSEGEDPYRVLVIEPAADPGTLAPPQ